MWKNKMYSVKQLIEALEGFYSDHKYDMDQTEDVVIDEFDLEDILSEAKIPS